MLHSASKNHTRAVRLITNPPVSLNQPFEFNRSNPADFSIVERKTLKELGVERLDFSPAVPRLRITPKRLDVQSKLLAEELEREWSDRFRVDNRADFAFYPGMKAHAAKHGTTVDSEHADVPVDQLKESLTPPMVRAT